MICLGSVTKREGCGSKRRFVEVDENMVYIPLSSIQSHPDVLNDFCDGSVYKSHPIFSVHENSLQLFLYYDDVKFCNPLESKSKFTNLVSACAQFYM